MSRVAIVAALPGELKALVRGWARHRQAGVDLWRRTEADHDWIAACAGSGSAAAGRAFAAIEKEGTIDLVVSVGWAGALREEFAPGSAYRVAGVVDANTGERFPAAAAPTPASDARASSGSPGSPSRDLCWLVTSRRVADRAEKRRLAAAHAAGLVDMEAAAVARLANARGIPFACAKAVTDGFADRLPDFNRFLAADGRFQQGRFMLFAAIRPWHWPALLRLARNSTRAAGALARSVPDLLADD